MSSGVVLHPTHATLRTLRLNPILNHIVKGILHQLKLKAAEMTLNITLNLVNILFVVLIIILIPLNLVVADGAASLCTGTAVKEVGRV
jgi:hypothetical protein